MTFATLAADSGREPFEFIEIEVDRCQLTYGLSPCPAPMDEGDAKCHNSWQTCPVVARGAFDPAPYWIRLCVPREVIPLDFTFADDGLPFFLPFLGRTKHSPGRVDAGRNLGVRSSVKITLSDAPHHDIGVDKYATERSYDAMDRGLFLQNLRARWPYMIGRRLRWYRGYLPDDGAADYDDFQRRDYVIEKFDGPDERGRVTITGKDPLKLVDDERAQDPQPTTGVLAFDLEDDASPTTLRVSVGSEADYDQYPDVAGFSYVALNGEVIRYEGRTASIIDDIPTITLLNVQRNGLPLGYETERQSHDAGDTVQLCSYRRGRVIDVVQELLLTAPGFDPTWIPFSDWDAEYETWLSGFQIERLIIEPEGIRSLIDEIIEQTMTWGFWWCERCNEVKFRAIRPPDIDEEVTLLTDTASFLEGEFKLRERPEDLINELHIHFAQRDPSIDRDDVSNYARGIVTVDVESQSANEVGARRVRTIYARWHRNAGSASVQQFSERTLNQLSTIPVEISFDVLDKDDLDIAQFADLSSVYLRSIISWQKAKRVQISRITREDGKLAVESLEDFYRGRFARIGEAADTGLMWSNAEADDRERYVFIAASDGTMSDGSQGVQLV